jgi:hypothetical protein
VKGLDAVGGHVETTHGSDRPQGLFGQVHVGRVVLDQENVTGVRLLGHGYDSR